MTGIGKIEFGKNVLVKPRKLLESKRPLSGHQILLSGKSSLSSQRLQYLGTCGGDTPRLLFTWLPPTELSIDLPPCETSQNPYMHAQLPLQFLLQHTRPCIKMLHLRSSLPSFTTVGTPEEGLGFFICASPSICAFTSCSVLATLVGAVLLSAWVWQCQLPAAFIIKKGR